MNFKINLLLIVLLSTSLKEIQTRGGTSQRLGGGRQQVRQPGRGWSGHHLRADSDANSRKFNEAIRKADINLVKEAIERGVDVNKPSAGGSPLAVAIESSKWYSGDPEENDSLKIIEILLQHGANADQPVIVSEWGSHRQKFPLKLAITTPKPNSLPIIRMLLRYGAPINEEIFREVLGMRNSDEVFKVLDYHQNLRKQALVNPNKELLQEAMSYDNPFIVKLLIQAGLPIDEEDLKYAEDVLSEASAKVLRNHLASIAKFREIAKRQDVPSEIVEQIERFARYKQ